MTQSFHFYLRLLLLLVAVSTTGYGGITIFKRRKKGTIMNPTSTGKRTVNVARRMIEIVIWCSGFIIGYAVNDLRQFHHTYVLTGIRVVQQYDSQRYQLAFVDTHDSFETKFCQDYQPQFEAGMILKELVYEDRGECWAIGNHKLGYKIARDQQGKVLRQGEPQ